ncbi:MAG: type II toxin-antitoxin system Phd/YefM family antitoxin [Patescibacteria group bacterium]|jgi:prevent-host-death family protein
MNDLKVALENIIPLTYARDHFSNIVNEVQRDKMYILTKGGKPAIALIDVRYLEQLTGGLIKKAEIKEEIDKNPEQVGLPKMVEHHAEPPKNPSAPPPPSQNFGSLKFKPSVPPPPGKPALLPNKPLVSPPPVPKPNTPTPTNQNFTKPTPPPAPTKPSAPSPSTPPSSVPKPTAPEPKAPTPPTLSSFTPSPAEPKVPTPFVPPTPPPPAAEKPATPGQLIMPGSEKSPANSSQIPINAQPKNPSSGPNFNDNAKIEVEFSNADADLEAHKTEKPHLEPDDEASSAQYKGENSEPEEMEIG